MHSSFQRLALAALLAGSASVAPLLGVGAEPYPATTPVAAVKSIGAVVALTASGAAPSTRLTNVPPPAAPTVTHGMLAAEFAGTGTYGAPLISGCTWATWVTNCQNLTAYGNGSSFNDVGCGTPNGCKFGSEFQCSELAQRYAYYAWGEPAIWGGGAAYTMWTSGPNLPIPLARYANGAGIAPMQGDLMIFGPGWLGRYWDGSGHVAIVRDIGPGYVDIVEQNATSSGTDRFPLNGSLVTANGYTPIIGWLRQTEQTPIELAASTVLGTPKSVSDQPGNIDVLWRGTDSKLHDLAYRNLAWQGQTMTAITPVVNIATDPAVVSPVPGQVDAFWADSSGNLWQVQSQSGYFGSEIWLAPQELTVGTLAVGSTPTAVSQAPGEMEVIWRAADNTLWADSYNGTWSGAMPLDSGVVAGNPDAVATSSGMVGVVWRDTAGKLWSDLGSSFGWFGAHQVGTGGLSNDPTVVASAAGTFYAVWRTQPGSIWAASITPNGGPGQVVVDSAVSMGRPVAARSSTTGLTVVMQRQTGLVAALYDPSNGWVGPQKLNQVLASSYLSVVNWYSGAVAAFWQGSGGSLWWSAACDGCAAHPPPVFTP